MASPWFAAARTARLAFQHYGGPSLLVGGLAFSSGAAPSVPGISSPIDSNILLESWQQYVQRIGNTTACEAAAAGSTTDNSSEAETRASKKLPVKKDDTSKASLRRRMTNVGRFSLLSETIKNPSVPVLILCLTGKPWSAQDFMALYEERGIAKKHERFQSVVDPKTHQFVLLSQEEDNGKDSSSASSSLPVYDMLAYPQIYRREVKSLINDALLQPLNLSETLWQAWALTGGKVGQSGAVPSTTISSDPKAVESLLLFRAHHCMADGVSLGAIFGDLMDEGQEFQATIQQKVKAFQQKKKSWWKKLQIFLYYWCWGSIRAFAYQFYLYFYSLFLSPPSPWKMLQRTEDPDQEHQRSLSWVQIATIDEVKQVADYFTQQHRIRHASAPKRQKMTINDVFCSCISGATAKLMEYHRRQGTTDKDITLPYMNLVMPVHMQGGILLPGQSMGNKIGAIVSQVPAEATRNAGDRLHQVHETLWTRKQTPTAIISYMIANGFGGTLGTLLGPRVTSWLFSKAHANASVVVTNVRGPEKAAHLGGRKVEANLGFLPLPPGVPIGMVVMSYDQKITLTVMAEPWAVPDADRFLSWVVEEYQELLRQSQESRSGNNEPS